MFEYIKGKLATKNPAYVIVEANGIGYFINISLNTYSELNDTGETFLFLHHVIREDAQLFFGFAEETERKLFRQLISVSGVGANTARVILSSLGPVEVVNAIIEGNTKALQGIKGIGLKTAQRIIVDLRDKVDKTDSPNEIFIDKNNTTKEEALYALTMLGFPQTAAKKAIESVLSKQKEDVSVEELIKLSLKLL